MNQRSPSASIVKFFNTIRHKQSIGLWRNTAFVAEWCWLIAIISDWPSETERAARRVFTRLAERPKHSELWFKELDVSVPRRPRNNRLAPDGRVAAKYRVSGQVQARQSPTRRCSRCRACRAQSRRSRSRRGRVRKLVLLLFTTLALNTSRLDTQFYRLAQARGSQIGFRTFAKLF